MELSAEEKQYNKMTKQPIPSLVTSLAAPTIVSMLTTAIYNMADTFFVSQLGTSASAAVGVVFSLMSVIQAFGFSIGMGSGSYISRFLGKKDHESADVYASSACTAAVLIGLIIMVFGLIFLAPFMRLLGSTETILPYSCDYAFYILIGAPIMCAAFVLNNVLRAEGKAAMSMIGLTIGGVLNIALDPLLIYVFNMGIKGAAVATLISQTVSLVITLSFFITDKSIVKLSLVRISRKKDVYAKIVKCGLPTLTRQGLASVATAVLSICCASYGDAAIAAMNIATKIYLFVRNAVIGIGQGFQPVAGFNYGAKKYKRVKAAFWFAVLLGTSVCVAAAILIGFNTETFISVFRKGDTEVIEVGSRALTFYAAVLPFLAYSTFVNQIFQCLGKSKRATFLASCRQGVFYLPIILILPHFIGITGIEAVQALSDFLTFLVSIPFQRSFFRSKNGLNIEDKLG